MAYNTYSTVLIGSLAYPITIHPLLMVSFFIVLRNIVLKVQPLKANKRAHSAIACIKGSSTHSSLYTEIELRLLGQCSQAGLRRNTVSSTSQ